MEMEGCIILSFIDVFGIFLIVMNKSKSSRQNNNEKKIKEERAISSSCVPNGSSLCERKNRSQENRLGVVKRGCHLYKQCEKRIKKKWDFFNLSFAFYIQHLTLYRL
jgi:hypothetical protein